ncbi:hypothetical protein DEO72_LG5g1533 [Vigna unguiculata]|uniref:Uncharacterized protein n=1 Tax=Vigna unguiculata TaxID=3917 RepID=A0A4D6LYP4_VIGUN|nr:hypothetical protein DEO72_LG5g1533 [Vigna unguiculata]
MNSPISSDNWVRSSPHSQLGFQHFSPNILSSSHITRATLIRVFNVHQHTSLTPSTCTCPKPLGLMKELLFILLMFRPVPIPDLELQNTPTFHQLIINPSLGRYLFGIPKTSEKPERTELKHHKSSFRCVFPRSLRDSIGGTPIGRAFPAIPRRRSLIKWYSEPIGSRSVAR